MKKGLIFLAFTFLLTLSLFPNVYADTEVKCTPDYCDKMSTPSKQYFCVYDVGCVDISKHLVRPCGTGECCIEGGDYEVQECLPGLECCFTTSNKFKGECKETCEGIVTGEIKTLRGRTNNSLTYILIIVGAIIIGFIILSIILSRKK